MNYLKLFLFVKLSIVVLSCVSFFYSHQLFNMKPSDLRFEMFVIKKISLSTTGTKNLVNISMYISFLERISVLPKSTRSLHRITNRIDASTEHSGLYKFVHFIFIIYIYFYFIFIFISFWLCIFWYTKVILLHKFDIL